MSAKQQSSIEVILCGDEKNKVIVVDNFHPEPQALVEESKKQPPFVEQKSDFYPGKRKIASETYSQFISEYYEDTIREAYGIPYYNKFSNVLSAYSLTTTPEDQLRPIQCAPHIDSHEENRFAIVHYLCDEHFGGTSFYRHKSSGYESIDDERFKPYFALLKPEMIQQGKSHLGYMNGDSDLFERVYSVNVRFNRAVIYPSCVLHSGDIDSTLGLIADPTLGRLTINSFTNFSS